jgi:serine/threonine-protein kinase
MVVSASPSDRNLLFGILALQVNFITRDALIKGMNAWVLEKQRPLGQVLVEQGALRQDLHDALEVMVGKHLEMHDNDPQKSLAAVSSVGSVPDELKQIADPDVQASIGHVAADSWRTQAPATPPSSRGVRYKRLRRHARGGLGEVFVALDEELQREVALKEIQDHHADREASQARFLLEAEITGKLEHPGVVPVYGLGRYDDGRPFYAMRFVKGDSLKEAIERFHKKEASTDPGERAVELRGLLGRFLDMCDAVAYAHSRGVLHRDLKPGNVMLGRYGETLVVDWGLAKLLGHKDEPLPSGDVPLTAGSAGDATPTEAGLVIGTPQFMSPEQAAGRLDLLGPASDVYSLGATLYCLLTGQAPFPSPGPDGPGALLRKVEQGEFPPPRRLKPEVPRPLEAICCKAMAGRPEDRYASPEALARDMQQWLADEPVAAYPEPLWVRARRWARRYRTALTAAVAAVTVAAVCLAGATGLLAVANQREREARAEVTRQRDEVQTQKERADRNLARARQAVQTYCTNVANDPRLKQVDLRRLRKKLLQTAVPFYEEFVRQRADDPDLQADRGQAYGRLAFLRGEMGEHAEAISDYRRMQDVFRQLSTRYPLVSSHRQNLALSHNSLGIQLIKEGRNEQAEGAFRRALALQKELVRDFPNLPLIRHDLAMSYANLGNRLALRGRPKEAEQRYRQALVVQTKLVEGHPGVPPYREQLVRILNTLAGLLVQTGRGPEAEALLRRALAVQEKLTRDYPAVPTAREGLADVLHHLAMALKESKRLDKAEQLHRRALGIRAKLAEDYPSVPSYRRDLAQSYHNLAVLCNAEGRQEEAEEALRRATAIREKLGRDFPKVPDYRRDWAMGCHNLALLLLKRGNRQEAEVSFRRALALWEELARDHPDVPSYLRFLGITCHSLGELLAQTDRTREAQECYQRGLAAWAKLLPKAHEPADSARLARTASVLLKLLHDKVGPREALEVHGQVVAVLRPLLAADTSSQPLRFCVRDVYRAQATALTRLAKYAEAVKAWDRAIELAAGPSRTFFRQHRAICLIRLGDHAGAVAEAEAIARQRGVTGGTVYNSACVVAQAFASVKEEATLGKRYGDRALALLEQAVALGYRNLAHIKKDPDLDPLRSRADFQKLLARLERELKDGGRR